VAERYEIIVAGTAGPLLLTALDGFEPLPAEPGRTRLVGTLTDDAALHGALHRLQDLHVELLGLRRLPPD
jgi:hypothetical protein